MQWKIVLSIELVTTQARHEDPQLVDLKTKDGLDALHKRKIDLCDEVMVLDVDGYIGESTRSEIDYAILTGKPVLYLSELYPDYVEPDDPVPAQYDGLVQQRDELCAEVDQLLARVERLEGIISDGLTRAKQMVAESDPTNHQAAMHIAIDAMKKALAAGAAGKEGENE